LLLIYRGCLLGATLHNSVFTEVLRWFVN